jgi:hypothetical protein
MSVLCFFGILKNGVNHRYPALTTVTVALPRLFEAASEA